MDTSEARIDGPTHTFDVDWLLHVMADAPVQKVTRYCIIDEMESQTGQNFPAGVTSTLLKRAWQQGLIDTTGMVDFMTATPCAVYALSSAGYKRIGKEPRQIAN